MKLIYQTNNLEAVEDQLEAFESKWSKQQPAMAKSWKRNWEGLSTFFDYHPEIRNIMYTINSIEGFNRQLRKLLKQKKPSLPKEFYINCFT